MPDLFAICKYGLGSLRSILVTGGCSAAKRGGHWACMQCLFDMSSNGVTNYRSYLLVCIQRSMNTTIRGFKRCPGLSRFDLRLAIGFTKVPPLVTVREGTGVAYRPAQERTIATSKINHIRNRGEAKHAAHTRHTRHKHLRASWSQTSPRILRPLPLLNLRPCFLTTQRGGLARPFSTRPFRVMFSLIIPLLSCPLATPRQYYAEFMSMKPLVRHWTVLSKLHGVDSSD